MELLEADDKEFTGPFLCPGCGVESRRLSGPLKGGPSPMAQRAEFHSYQCWLNHRAVTGQDDWHR